MSYVIKIGGSLLFDKDGTIKSAVLKKYCEIIRSSNKISAIICGGGILARKYISAAAELGVSESYKDLLGIDISRLNARMFIAGLGDLAYPIPIKSVEEAMVVSSQKKIIVSGGFIPGQSTTTVAMEIAEAINAQNLLIFTDVDGIYDKNPKEFPDAKKYEKITIEELESVILGVNKDSQSAAGEYRIFDAVSIQIFKRGNLRVRLLNGNKPDMFEKLLSEDIINSKIGTMVVK